MSMAIMRLIKDLRIELEELKKQVAELSDNKPERKKPGPKPREQVNG